MADQVDGEILESIKSMLGLPKGYDPFDSELTIHINSAIANLTQLGVGPASGLTIDGDTKWSALLSNNSRLNHSKTFIFMKVKMLFDASSMTQPLILAYEKMIEEASWRLQIAADPLLPAEGIASPDSI